MTTEWRGFVKVWSQGWVCNSMVEHLPCMCGALGLVPSTTKLTNKPKNRFLVS